ncbi:N4-gp56 family major capsid protein [Paracoccus sp. Z330]|uniref:N4-gp56 family major capsid protein n=1 Tax=Paracoccus onchidii TaxID=3017813 RepID=A0ABT4ZIE2_9RHOB|nr:N4-gp56 family major capsid protein [Paracoccus onchidii]MDB6178999.1 N4-gp56 family major capsid protein [Paracoccus onchidii]
MQTIVGVNDPRAVKRWANALAADTEKQMYFTRFIGKGENNMIERKVELESDAGDRVSFDLSMRLRGGMSYGDEPVEGREESLTLYTDEVLIDQARKGADAGGRMSRKRTLHDLRMIAKDRTAEYVAEWGDELFMVYLSGDAAMSAANEDAKIKGPFAGNPIQAPDPAHMAYGGSANSKATLTSANKMTRDLIERVSVIPRMMNAIDPDTVKMSPITVEGGGKHFVTLMSPWQMHDMRTEAGERSWSEMQKAAAGAEGRKNPIFTGSAGMINNVVLHEHENVRRFTDYGAGQDVHAARALFLGRQAGVVAYGEAGNKTRFQWTEETKDAGNRVAIYAGCIMGAKKTRFNGRDFGVIAVDTASTNPNPVIAA